MMASLVVDMGSSVKNYFVFQNQLVLEKSTPESPVFNESVGLLRLKDLENENARLRQALNFQQSTPGSLSLESSLASPPIGGE